jgi:hypothetical protein
MTVQQNVAPHALNDPELLEELQFLEHRIRLGPTHSGWVSFVARQGHRPTILVAPDRETLLMETHKLIERRIEGRT